MTTEGSSGVQSRWRMDGSDAAEQLMLKWRWKVYKRPSIRWTRTGHSEGLWVVPQRVRASVCLVTGNVNQGMPIGWRNAESRGQCSVIMVGNVGTDRRDLSLLTSATLARWLDGWLAGLARPSLFVAQEAG